MNPAPLREPPTQHQTPTLSIVMPTYGRCNWIDEAITSCLEIADGQTQIEVLVCVNGVDPSAIPELEQWTDCASVRVLSTPLKGANPARNLGLRHAKGRYVIFLDDDDYLVPENVKLQLKALDTSGADVCSGNALVVDQDGAFVKRMGQCANRDMAIASLSGEVLALIHTHCYRRGFLDDIQWDESLSALQDPKFIYDLVAVKEVRWEKVSLDVGVWRWHGAPRISTTNTMNKFLGNIQATRSAVDTMRQRGALSEDRKKAAAKNIWNNLHAIFEHDLKWSLEIAAVARELDPDARPATGRWWLQPLVNRFPVATEIAYSGMRSWIKRVVLNRTPRKPASVPIA